MANGEFEYDVAVSFAGEDRATAERFAKLLKAEGFSVFYDFWNKADLWGRNLYAHLAEVYSKKARFCVMFLSAAYAKKAWTRHEMQAAQERAFRENEAYILPVRLDDTAIPGIGETVAYLDLRRESVEEVAQIAAEKIRGARSRGAADKGQAQLPAASAAAAPAAQKGKLRLKKQFTEQDRDNFLEAAYEVIAKYFEESLTGLAAENPGFVGKFRKVNANHFTAVIYRNGKNVGQCGIRLGGLGGGFTNQIVYSNDPNATNSMNEGVSVANDGEEMFLNALGMSSFMGPQQKDRLTPHDAAELFWGILTAPLQR
jgi:hypothetical protein